MRCSSDVLKKTSPLDVFGDVSEKVKHLTNDASTDVSPPALNDGHSTSGSAVHKKALSDLKTNQTLPRDKNGKNYVLQNNSTGLTKVFVASLDCLTNGWISLNHRHSIESNGCRSKIHCHSIYTVDHFPTIHSLTMVL